MNRDSGMTLTSLKVDGGMTSNNLLMQLQADLVGIDVGMCRCVCVYQYCYLPLLYYCSDVIAAACLFPGHTHIQSVLTAIFPGEPGLARSDSRADDVIYAGAVHVSFH